MAERIIGASLHVSNLHPNLNEAVLYGKFSRAGRVLSVKVCRDVLTGASLGTAYVNFSTPTDAENALKTLNFEEVHEQPMRIQWSQRDPSLRRSGNGNIFVKNLDKSIGDKEFYSRFSSFGTIVSSKVERDHHGESKGFGYVQFESQESAERAINEVDGTMFKEKKLYVGKFESRKKRPRKFTCIRVSNLEENITMEQLADVFKQFGQISCADVKTDSQGRCKGFGFVTYVTPEAASKAVELMNGKKLNGNEIVVTEEQQQQRESPPERR